MVVGVALFAAERRLRSHGLLGTLGLTALIAGMAMAVLDASAEAVVVLALAIPALTFAAYLGVVVTGKSLSADRTRARCGAEGLVGHIGMVRRPLDPVGQVAIDGELWRARRSWADEHAPAPAVGEAVVVERVSGLTLGVRRAEDWEVES